VWNKPTLTLEVPTVLREYFSSQDDDALFDTFMQLQGKPFRDVPGRKTMQVSIDIAKNGVGETQKSYFLKLHFGVGWGEIFKNIFSLKMPILGAMTEVSAIQKCAEIGIPTTPLVAYGQKGCNPATQQSFLLTDDLGDIISLEDLCADWKNNPPDQKFKNLLIIALAKLAAALHGAGLCHRDFYLCHFVIQKQTFMAGKLELVLIDLHRMLQNQPSDGRAVMKDIAGLTFSAKDCGFSTQDWALFRQHYLPQSESFWQKVEVRTQKLYEKFHSEKFQARLKQEKSKL
jgi:UDP-glucose:(heptosyl)LPS alpha-1,3-glucosyltransferase/heptose I phosphotransferase